MLMCPPCSRLKLIRSSVLGLKLHGGGAYYFPWKKRISSPQQSPYDNKDLKGVCTRLCNTKF